MPTVFITGANRGIGLEFARQYGTDGWTVIATCRNPITPGQLATIPGDIQVHGLDVNVHEQVDRLRVSFFVWCPAHLGSSPVSRSRKRCISRTLSAIAILLSQRLSWTIAVVLRCWATNCATAAALFPRHLQRRNRRHHRLPANALQELARALLAGTRSCRLAHPSSRMPWRFV